MKTLLRPRQAYYGIGLLFLVLAGLASHRFYERRLAAVAAGLTQVVVPGSATVTFPRAGHGTVFLEYRSAVGSRYFLTAAEAGSLSLTIAAAGTGREVGLERAWLPLRYRLDRRTGVAIRDFWIDSPGAYDVVGVYPPGSAGSSMVLAVGYGLLGDLRGEVAGGLGAIGGLLVAALASFVTVWWMRKRSRRRVYGRFTR